MQMIGIEVVEENKRLIEKLIDKEQEIKTLKTEIEKYKEEQERWLKLVEFETAGRRRCEEILINYQNQINELKQKTDESDKIIKLLLLKFLEVK